MGMLDPPLSITMLTDTTRHCADAVLSFSNEITLVARVAAPLLDFTSAWARSNSSYDFLIAQTFPPSWCSLHRPVISLPSPAGHWVYSAVNPLEPDGYPVTCHRGCGRDSLDPATTSRKVKITCLLCRSSCEVKLTDVDGWTPLGRKEIVKVPFPPTACEDRLESSKGAKCTWAA